ncbi:MAG: 2-succinyl-5-enolpyruvyl-6-hydroxy-3-cyclohexene-1-carboxylic-acid synthase [Cyanobacteriota bacterium]
MLQGCVDAGVRLMVLCPGSRSGPLAVAAGWIERKGVELVTAIDERSAAFFALGHGRATGLPAAVITTSGTAVANLLPAAVESDYGAIPLLLLTADRPARLQGCGANQTVNQEAFLRPSLRWQGLADPAGLHRMDPGALRQLAADALRACLGQGGQAPGPVQLNLPLEEPLHGNAAVLRGLGEALPPPVQPGGLAAEPCERRRHDPGEVALLEPLNPDQPGLIVAGPWRGRPQHQPGFLRALHQLQRRTGWPLLADALSGLRGTAELELVAGYDLLLAAPRSDLQARQVLRLGPVPASRRLQSFLRSCGGHQLLISEGEPRSLDALRCATAQFDGGLEAWWGGVAAPWGAATPALEAQALARRWLGADRGLQAWLDQWLDQQFCGPTGPAAGGLSEPALTRRLSRLLPAGLPLVLANSSPVRDWESFMPPDAPPRAVVSFRGASGIDGTLSLACGVAQADGAAVLITGDLALLHDANGWLWRRQLHGRLTVLLLDNGGGGIFEQLPIRPDPERLLDFDRLFAMPQAVDPLALAAAHGVPGRSCADLAALEVDLAWALAQPLALLRLPTDRRADAGLRQALRTMGAALQSWP